MTLDLIHNTWYVCIIGFRIHKWKGLFNQTCRLWSEPSSVIFIKIFYVWSRESFFFCTKLNWTQNSSPYIQESVTNKTSYSEFGEKLWVFLKYFIENGKKCWKILCSIKVLYKRKRIPYFIHTRRKIVEVILLNSVD